MNRPRDLGVLLDMAERQRDDAARALARMRQERRAAQGQMDQLHAYTRDAEQRWQQRATVGVSPTLLATHRQFMLKLEEAIAFQANVLQQLDDRIARQEGHLLEAERHLATLQRVQQRWQREWQQHQQRVEQKANDEMAATLHRRRHHPHA